MDFDISAGVCPVEFDTETPCRVGAASEPPFRVRSIPSFGLRAATYGLLRSPKRKVDTKFQGN